MGRRTDVRNFSPERDSESQKHRVTDRQSFGQAERRLRHLFSSPTPGEGAVPDILSAVCSYDAHILKTNQTLGMVNLCEQRLEGTIVLEGDSDGYRIWTTDTGKRKERFVHRIARISSAKDPNFGRVDLSNDHADGDVGLPARIRASFAEVRQNKAR